MSDVNSIARLREAAGKSRAEVAAELEISERHLYRLETGVQPMTRRWAMVFATYYGVPVDEIDGNGVAA